MGYPWKVVTTDFGSEVKVVTTDFGSGTLDISVLEKTEDGLILKATAGNPHLGGYDIDELIVKWALARYKKESSSFISPT